MSRVASRETDRPARVHRDVMRIPSLIADRPSEPLPLMRNPTCACGGGCARCSEVGVQTKLAVSLPGDQFEREADHIADQVMRMPDSKLQKQVKSSSDKSAYKRSLIGRSPKRAAGVIASDFNSRLGEGAPLDSESRAFFEPRFGHDFSAVRVHTGDAATRSAADVHARAYTLGHDIVFGAGEYRPQTADGRLLLAHELTHTIQQDKSPATIQRQPSRDDLSSRDPIHDPLLDQFSRETGVPRDQASQHSPEYEAWLMSHDPQANPAYVLNHADYTSSRYSSTVTAWSNDSPIWPALTTRQARINFVRFIISFDETNCVPLAGETTPRRGCSATAAAAASFSNACQGYASQMYARYTNAGRLPAADTAALESDAHVVLGNVPAKFHIPIRIATVPGHAFNAVLIDTDPADVNSWLFIEPQTDEVFFASDPRMTNVADIYGGRGLFTLSRLTGYNRGFQQTDERSFLSSSAGTFTNQVLSLSQRMFLDNFLRDIFIADDPSAFPFYTSRHSPPQTYEQLIASYASQPAADLAMAFTIVNGRSFRRAPGGATEVMTRAVYLLLVNKPGLDASLPP